MVAPEHAEVTATREELFFPVESMCFGCSPRNPTGLHLRFFRDREGILCETTLAAQYQGAPGVVHGGIQAVLIDETCCATAFFTTGSHMRTGSLDLRYRRPCPTGEPLEIRATIIRDQGRYLVIRAALHVAGGGDVVTEGEGRFFRHTEREDR